MGKEYKTIDYGFLKGPSEGIAPRIKEDYIINNLRFRYEAITLRIGNKRLPLIIVLSVMAYSEDEDLKDLIRLKFNFKTLRSGSADLPVDVTGMDPMILYIDFNENRILNQNYESKGTITRSDDQLIITEHKDKDGQTNFKIDRLTNTFSMIVLNEEMNTFQGTYEPIGEPVY